MNRQEKDPNSGLDRAIAAMRAQEPSAEVLQSATERVWNSIQQSESSGAVDSIRGCADVKTLLIQYQSGRLPAAKALLVESHLHECVDCRRFAERGSRESSDGVSPWKRELPRMDSQRYRWAMAATAVVICAFAAYLLREQFFAVPAGMRASIVSLEGGLYRVGVGNEQPLKTGDEIGENERVRTANGSHAMLQLADGSRVEMNERAQLAVSMRHSDTTINLDRGKVIVQAARRKSGHLYVAANDVKVSVTGTVFSVNSGMKGSRVSVIEGEVRVAGNGVDGVVRNAVLHPGEQLSTDAAGEIPLKQEIAWSKNLDQHLALLAEFAHLSNKLEAVQLPGVRYQSALLPTLPASTVLYASIPNLGDAVQQGNQIFQQELRESAVLQQWWTRVQSRKGAADYSAAIEEIHSLSQYLGNEIAFSVALTGDEAEPLAVAQVQKPGLKQFIEQEAARHEYGARRGDVRVFDETQIASATAASGKGRAGEKHNLYLLVRPDFVVAAFDINALKSFNQNASQGGGFAATPFGQRILGSYQQGAGFLFAANLQAMTAEHAARHPQPVSNGHFSKTGLAAVQYLIAERKDVGNQPLNHAELTFNGTRQGIASWLAAPAPIGALDFVSKDAGAAGALIAKNPSQMLDDILSIAGDNAAADMAKGESELKIRFRQDLADTLGGEVAFALDGPILPTPSWKVVLEVYAPGRLQSTIQQLIADVNDHKKEHAAEVTLQQEASGGTTFYAVQVNERGRNVEIDYAFVDGYMVIAPSRALVMNAIGVHQSGNSLPRSTSFRSLLPQDQHADVSAVLYQNLAPVVGPIMSQLTPSQLQSLQQLASETKPSVVCAYGDPQAITVASASRLFGLDLNTLTLSTLMNIAHPGKSANVHMD